MPSPASRAIPPCIPAPESISLTLRTLWDSAHCQIRTWPRAVYEDDFYRPPVDWLLFVMQPAAIREILIDQADNFPQGDLFRRIMQPVWRDGIATAEGEDWRWQRKAASPAFTPTAVRTLVPHANRAADALAEAWGARDGCRDISRSMGDAASLVVLYALLDGLGGDEDRRQLLHWAEALTAQMDRVNYADILRLPAWTRSFLGPTYRKPVENLHRLVAPILQRKLASPMAPDSLLALLSHSTDPETGRTMPEGLLRDNIVGSLAAGRETTALAMTWSLFLIARYESAQVRMREEVLSVTNNEPVQADHVERLVWTRQTIMEALRLYPPIPLIVRECQSDTEVKGQTIPKGKLVAIPIYAIHRHRKVWNDPDAFDPERFAPGQFSEREMRFAYMPFGGGKRICLGMHFALTEAIVLIANLVRRFHFSPAEGEPVEFAVGTALHPKRPVYLNVEALR